MLKLAISGAAGRMGARLVDLSSQDSDFSIMSAVESSNHPKLGTDAGSASGIGDLGVVFTSSFPEEIDVVIDFSLPQGADQAIKFCREKKIPLVMATTGLEPETIDELNAAAGQIPIVWAPSMSLAVNLTMKLVETAGQALKNHSTGVDVEIIERHHRFKADAPSGTALKFGDIISDSMGMTSHQHGRHGMIGERPQNEIGYHAIRTGDNPGEHTISFGMLGESIEIKVAASNRDCYAAGALAAAKFVVNQSPGMYNMFDVLGLN